MLCEPGHYQIGMSFNLMRTAVATEWTRTNAPLPELQVTPTAHACRTDAETLRSLPMRRSAIDGGKHTYAKID